MPEAYTLVTVLDDLKKKGYTLDFNIAFDKLQCVQNGVCLNPEQFEIVEHFRFEGDSNPDDQSILYAVESKDGTMKGVLVNAYGIYSDPVSDEMLQKLSAQK